LHPQSHRGRRWTQCWQTGHACRFPLTYFVLAAIPFALALLAFLAGSVALSRLARPAPRRQDLGSPVDSRPLVGGLLWHVGWLPWRVTAPMAELRVFDNGVLIGPSQRWLRILVPTWALTWGDIASVRENGTILELALRESRQRLRFSSFSPGLRRDFIVQAKNNLVDAKRS